MQVNSYLYQSPSSSSVQIGRLDPNSKSTSSNDTTELDSSTNTSSKNAQTFLSSQKSEVKPSVNTGNTLDVYA